jgi:hypothetical protein
MNDRDFRVTAIAEEIRGIIQDLCNLAGYGIHSGINIGEKGDAAANYILNKLHTAGLKDAKLEPIKVNSPLPFALDCRNSSGRH